jgi:hypothetical protein
MAQRPKLIKRSKPKPVRKTRSEQYLVNLKYLGDEPTATQIGKSTIRSINWYNAMCSKDEAREYMTSYLAAHNRSEDKKRLNKVSDTWLPLTACWLARMSVIAPMVAQTNNFDGLINEYLSESFKHAEPEKKVVATADRVSIQDRIKERGYDIIGDIEELIDKGEEFSLYDWLKKNEIPAMYSSKIIEYYSPWLMDLIGAFEGKIEGYSNFTKKELKNRIEFFGKMLEDAHRYNGNTKKARAPRKKKTVTAEKLLKNFKYQKDSNEHKLTSVSPTSILGAKILWTFNTRYNTLNVFNAMGPSGLSVRGSTITDFDESNSKSIKIGRKTAERLESVLTGGKIILRKLVEEMTGEVNGRINENTILLKVIK